MKCISEDGTVYKSKKEYLLTIYSMKEKKQHNYTKIQIEITMLNNDRMGYKEINFVQLI